MDTCADEFVCCTVHITGFFFQKKKKAVTNHIAVSVSFCNPLGGVIRIAVTVYRECFTSSHLCLRACFVPFLFFSHAPFSVNAINANASGHDMTKRHLNLHIMTSHDITWHQRT